MSDIFEIIASRHSYRGTYTDAPVPREDLIKIMQAGLDAPSGCNKQTTSIIAVDDPDLLSDLKALIDPPIAATAPAFICVLTQRIIAYLSSRDSGIWVCVRQKVPNDQWPPPFPAQ